MIDVMWHHDFCFDSKLGMRRKITKLKQDGSSIEMSSIDDNDRERQGKDAGKKQNNGWASWARRIDMHEQREKEQTWKDGGRMPIGTGSVLIVFFLIFFNTHG
jgi:hypothetical protein